jgi:hypothetical protein
MPQRSWNPAPIALIQMLCLARSLVAATYPIEVWKSDSGCRIALLPNLARREQNWDASIQALAALGCGELLTRIFAGQPIWQRFSRSKATS